ncbi:MAG: hypothetical protein HY094_07805 [Candidatus Melainabacteria bacterium]|nr:hypothetical protein [Candidatus Melainabacteria bacterium]
MKVNCLNSLRENLNNIVLLAKEYKEEIPQHIEEEIKSLESVVKSGHKINEYDRQFFNATQEHRRKIFDQIIHWAERAFIDLAKIDSKGKFIWGSNKEFILDIDKFNLMMKTLTKSEADLLESAGNLIFHYQFEPGEFELIIEHLLECANGTSSSATPDSYRSRKTQKSA